MGPGLSPGTKNTRPPGTGLIATRGTTLIPLPVQEGTAQAAITVQPWGAKGHRALFTPSAQGRVRNPTAIGFPPTADSLKRELLLLLPITAFGIFENLVNLR